MTVFPTGVTPEVLKHFLSMPHHQHWYTRLFAAFCIIGIIGLLEGLAAVAASTAWFIALSVLEVWTFRHFSLMATEIEGASDRQRDSMMARLFVCNSAIAAFYTLPAIGLSFGSQAGQIFGLILCASILINIANQHVVHPRLVFFSLPIPAFGLMLCATALADAKFWIIAFVVAILGLQIMLLARTGAYTYSALIDAKKTAIAEATARGAADSANQTKSDFLANMSHELRTPLNAVLGYGEILKENAEFESRQSDVKDIDKVLVSANRLLGLVNEILDMSKIEAGAMMPECRSFDVVQELQTTIDMLAPAAAKNGNALVLTLDPKLSFAISDPLRFSQCVLNLASNAIKFTKDGQVEVAVTLGSSPRGEIIRVTVSDTGIGIPADKLDLIFQPFAQADETSTRRYGGTGLGLSLTRALAQLMGGDVTVSSDFGKGSRFEMTILADLTPSVTSSSI